MKISSDNNILAIYHANCIDGLAAAWALGRHYQALQVPVSYLPYGHHRMAEAEKDILAALKPGMTVYFVDVAPTPAFLTQLMTAQNGQLAAIRILDHHKTASEVLAGYHPPVAPGGTAPLLDICIEPKHPSAATLVWEKLLPDEKPPEFLSVIAQMDLGENLETDDDYAAAALVDSKNISSVEDAFHSFTALSSASRADMTAQGHAILQDQKTRIGKLAKSMLYTSLLLDAGRSPVWIPVVNADVQNFGRYVSAFLRKEGQKTGSGIGMAWYLQGNGSVTMSIRSDEQHDATAVAQRLTQLFGISGGGHRSSAAVHFRSLQDFHRHIRLHTRQELLAAAPGILKTA